MDWAPVIDPFINADYLDDFVYGKSRTEDSAPLTVLRYQGSKFEPILLETESDWKKWLQESNIFTSSDQVSGFHVLLSPRIEPLQIPGCPPVPFPHYHLPFSRDWWDTITKTFKLHRAIIHSTTYNKCHSTLLRYRDNGTNQDLELHTAVAAAYHRPGSFSLSCTYFEDSKLSLAVLYGCDFRQTMRVTELLETSPEVASHPWLMVGVFAELQLNRMQDLVRIVHELCDPSRNGILLDLKESRRAVWQRYEDLLDSILKAKEVEEEVQVTRAQLKEMADRFAKKKDRTEKRREEQKRWEQWANKDAASSFPLEDNDLQDDHLEAADRFINRFRDIDMELNSLMTQCRVAAERQTQAGQMFMSEISRREAAASRVQAKQSTFLATIATLYLPITSVATIFAVPAFKFENWWVDTSFQPVNGEATKPVFSGYAIIYIVLSIFMTGITFLAYLFAKWRTTSDDDGDGAALAEEGQGRRTSMDSSSGPGASRDNSGKSSEKAEVELLDADGGT
ncbi:uncharacterized protein B0T15DRAFT_493474 [Chaetomium strumarium]|uniref:Uncharacterized protein n=1 Tax=Chaetomium strumarium TaxID=1170767 RepID=A0AAJ0M1D1_9PEZI|nr:hypothetical protein B0T15DRAFT_493474 [Chaetomium strumarium]